MTLPNTTALSSDAPPNNATNRTHSTPPARWRPAARLLIRLYKVHHAIKAATAHIHRLTLHMYSRGSHTLPFNALAAAVYGEAKYTCPSLCPMRPGKFLLVVLTHTSGSFIRAKVSRGPPKQAAHEGAAGVMQPAASKISAAVLPPQPGTGKLYTSPHTCNRMEHNEGYEKPQPRTASSSFQLHMKRCAAALRG